jgi:transposase
MLSLPPSVRIFVYTAPADMRKSFSGLSALVEQHMQLDSFSGHLFIFRNKRGDKLKCLYWDRDGYALWYKRLEKGTFQLTLPADASGDCHIEMRAADLAMLLDGVDFSSVKRQKRWRREPTGNGAGKPVEKSSPSSH